MRSPARIAGLVAALVLAAGAASAAEPRERPKEGKKAEDKRTDEKKVIQLQEMEVKGKVQKPVIPALTPPPSAIPREPEREGSFVQKIVGAADRDPF